MSATASIPELDVDPYSAENLLHPYPLHQRLRDVGPAVSLKPYPKVVA